jgi:hypothetical protein
VSKRHQANRRRSYGRRQHELHEREVRRHFPEPADLTSGDAGTTLSSDPLAFMDPRSPRLRFALGD